MRFGKKNSRRPEEGHSLKLFFFRRYTVPPHRPRFSDTILQRASTSQRESGTNVRPLPFQKNLYQFFGRPTYGLGCVLRGLVLFKKRWATCYVKYACRLNGELVSRQSAGGHRFRCLATADAPKNEKKVSIGVGEVKTSRVAVLRLVGGGPKYRCENIFLLLAFFYILTQK